MYIFVTILIITCCILLSLVVLVQNSKGGGLSGGLSSSNQVMGVRKTTDFLEKLTWGLAITLVVLSLAANFAIPRGEGGQAGSAIQEQIDNSAVPAAPQQPAAQPQGDQQQQPAAAPAPAPAK